MRVENDGFSYPFIDSGKCVDCGICTKICPVYVKNPNKNEGYESIVYAGWSNDAENRFYSTSGGAFFEIAKRFIEDGGCVVAAEYNDKNLVVHGFANTIAELKEFRQSKYIQSDVGSIYKRIQSLLNSEIKVLFCGTPCQTSAVQTFLKKTYDNLLTVNFICRGVNSPKAYSAWLYEIEKKEKSKVVKVWFKNKTYGWKNSPWCTKIVFSNGKEKLFYQKDNLFMRGYLVDNLYMRKCCGNCRFKNPQSYADITLGDFWGANSAIDDDKGTSVIFANTKKGYTMVSSIKPTMELMVINSGEVDAGNVCLHNSAVLNTASDIFLKDLDSYGFSKAYIKYKVRKKISKLFK